MLVKTILKIGVSFALGMNIASAQSVEITGAGASLPYPIYAQWAAAYHEQTGQRVNYQSIGSGGGQQQIIAGTVAFGASDDQMPEQALLENVIFNISAIIGGVDQVFNLPCIDTVTIILN